MTDQDQTTEAPLDPATERVRRKMVRLLGVSIGIMLIGVMAVLVAVVYRTTEGREAELAPGASVPFAIPAGSQLLSADLDGDHILLRVGAADGGGEELLVLSRLDGSVVSRHPIAAR